MFDIGAGGGMALLPALGPGLKHVTAVSLQNLPRAERAGVGVAPGECAAPAQLFDAR